MNARAYANQTQDSFQKFLIVSALVHASFALLVGIKNLILPGDIIEIPNAIRVDVVALPDKMPDNPIPVSSPQKAEEPVAKPVPQEKKKPEPVVKKENLKESQKKAIEQLKAKSAIEKIREQLAREKPKGAGDSNPKPQADGTPTQFKGNVISSGNSFTGMSRLRVNGYLDDITTRIRQNWELPQWLSDANLKAAVLISIDSRGVIVHREIQASSGNSVFDSSCLAAVEAASPFTSPPDEVKDRMILIRFPFQ